MVHQIPFFLYMASQGTASAALSVCSPTDVSESPSDRLPVRSQIARRLQTRYLHLRTLQSQIASDTHVGKVIYPVSIYILSKGQIFFQ